MKQLIILVAVIAVVIFAMNQRSKLQFADIQCPYCGSSEVVKYTGDKCHCMNCEEDCIMINE